MLTPDERAAWERAVYLATTWPASICNVCLARPTLLAVADYLAALETAAGESSRRLAEVEGERDQFRFDLQDAEEHESQLETAIRTFLTLHGAASGRPCLCRICEMLRAALAAAEEEK